MTESITVAEISMLLGLAAARDQRTVGDADILAWHSDLNAAHITYKTAAEALTRYYAVEQPRLPAEHRFRVTVTDLIAVARKMRAERLDNFQYEPGPDDDDARAYLRRRRQQLAEVASGERPAQLPAVGTPSPELNVLLGGVGRRVSKVRVLPEAGR